MALKKNNLFYLLLCPLIFSTCSTSANLSAPFINNSSSSFFSSFPSNGGLVFIGVAGKRSNPNETLKLALEDAAQRVAVFYHVSGEYAVKNNIGSGAFDYSYKTRTKLYTDKDQSIKYVDALQYNTDTDSIEIDNSLFIRTIYPSSLPKAVNFNPKYRGADRRPDWIDNPPNEIDGYIVGVGFSGRYSSMTDTFTNSWYNAVFAIIRNINSSAQSSDLLYNNTGNLFGYKTSSDNLLYSFGALDCFYALDTWIDPKAKSVWTLAIAKKSG
jgi:hypothetical protein